MLRIFECGRATGKNQGYASVVRGFLGQPLRPKWLEIIRGDQIGCFEYEELITCIYQIEVKRSGNVAKCKITKYDWQLDSEIICNQAIDATEVVSNNYLPLKLDMKEPLQTLIVEATALGVLRSFNHEPRDYSLEPKSAVMAQLKARCNIGRAIKEEKVMSGTGPIGL